jgi:hypothetical protein
VAATSSGSNRILFFLSPPSPFFFLRAWGWKVQIGLRGEEKGGGGEDEIEIEIEIAIIKKKRNPNLKDFIFNTGTPALHCAVSPFSSDGGKKRQVSSYSRLVTIVS